MGLNKSEIKYIQKNTYSIEHSWQIDTFLFGEPFLFDNILTYDDGENITACLFPFDFLQPSDNLLSKMIKMIERGKRNSLKIYGKREYIERINVNNNLLKFYYYKSDLPNNEFIYSSKKSPKALQSYRAGKKRGYTFNIQTEEPLSVKQINLIKEIACSRAIYDIEFDYICLFPVIAQIKHLYIHNTFDKECNIIGISFFYEFSKGNFFNLISFNHKSSHKYISDFALGSFIDYYPNDIKILLGSGSTLGLNHFKKKWGNEINTGTIDGAIITLKGDNSLLKRDLGIWWIDKILSISKNNI
ncbi:MAG: hypothetical protein U5L09_10470 [Bacteroidales bacterium]|nr:hypothetical protein [Bacteroidales bacterium]